MDEEKIISVRSDVIVNIASDPLSLSRRNGHMTLFHAFEKKVSLHA